MKTIGLFIIIMLASSVHAQTSGWNGQPAVGLSGYTNYAGNSYYYNAVTFYVAGGKGSALTWKNSSSYVAQQIQIRRAANSWFEIDFVTPVVARGYFGPNQATIVVSPITGAASLFGSNTCNASFIGDYTFLPVSTSSVPIIDPPPADEPDVTPYSATISTSVPTMSGLGSGTLWDGPTLSLWSLSSGTTALTAGTSIAGSLTKADMSWYVGSSLQTFFSTVMLALTGCMAFIMVWNELQKK